MFGSGIKKVMVILTKKRKLYVTKIISLYVKTEPTDQSRTVWNTCSGGIEKLYRSVLDLTTLPRLLLNRIYKNMCLDHQV